MIRIGDLKKRVIFQYQTKVPDGMGGFTATWANHATVDAAIWPISATEQVQTMQKVMTITHQIRIRYRDNIKAHWRIKYGLRYFDIVSIINPSMSNRYLDIMVKEAT